MAYEKIKTEAGKRNGKGRWCRRADAKEAANKSRRDYDRILADSVDDIDPLGLLEPFEPCYPGEEP